MIWAGYTLSEKDSMKFLPTCSPMSAPTKSLNLHTQQAWLDNTRVSESAGQEWQQMVALAVCSHMHAMEVCLGSYGKPFPSEHAANEPR